jgi:hypothetical protein
MARTVDKNQTIRLDKVGTRLPYKYPNCQKRGQLRVAHEPKWTGWLLWCYTCGYKV